jgi:uncharacterized tellurite resistance protein B-like protein
MSWLERLGFARPEGPREEGILEAIERGLPALPDDRRRLVAAFAGLLVRVAYADDEISEPEAARVESHLFALGLSPDEARAIAVIARNRTTALRGAGQHLVTRAFNEVATEDEKRQVIDALYAIATADDLVTHVEDREVRAIGDALLLPPSVVLSIRSRYREKLEEMRELRKLRGE